MNKRFATIMLPLLAAPVAAQDKLPDLMVSGERGAVVPLEQFRNPPADTPQALRAVPGVDATRMGGHGSDPMIRGQSQTRLNVLLDGAYVHGGCPNRMDPPTAYAPLSSYDEVEIHKGAGTVQYGGGGSGGTVLLKRKPPKFKENQAWLFKGTAGYRANGDNADLALDASAGSNRLYVRGLYNYADSGNYEDGAGHAVRSAFTTHNSALMAGYAPGPLTQLALTLESTRESDVLYAGAGMDAPQSDNDMARFSVQHDWLRGELYYSDVTHVMDNYSLRPLVAGAMKMRADTTSRTWGGRLLADIERGNVTWTVGLDYQANDRDALRRAGPANGGDPASLQSLMWPQVSITQAGLFAEGEWALDSQRQISAGLRYTHAQAEAANGSQAAGGMTPNDLYRLYYGNASADDSAHQVSGFATYKVKAGPMGYFVTASRSVRNADASERFMASNSKTPSGRWVGNPGLHAEQHHQLELGLNQGTGQNWQYQVSVFSDWVTDYILRDKAKGQAGVLQKDLASIYRNVDARLWGAEWQSSAQWGNWLAKFNLAYVRGDNQTDHLPLAQMPPWQGTLDLRYQHTNIWHAGGALRFAAAQHRTDAAGAGQDPGESSGFGVVDWYGQYNLHPHWNVQAGVDNVFDRAYAYHVSRANADPFYPEATRVNEPGRAFWLRLQGTW